MNRRPRFWLHRSPRFWLGLLGFAFILGSWVASSFWVVELRNLSIGSTSFSNFRAGFGGGGLIIEKSSIKGSPGEFGTPHSEWNTRITRILGMGLSPNFEWHADRGQWHTPRRIAVFLPLWIFLLPCSLGWIIWMHRADKREEKLFGVDRDGSSSPSSNMRQLG